jgi:hypothetical protein
LAPLELQSIIYGARRGQKHLDLIRWACSVTKTLLLGAVWSTAHL